MAKCDLDECSLKEDIGEIKKNQKEMTQGQNKRDINQATFEQKMDDYMKQGIKEHEILFARTKVIPQGNVKWTHLFMALGGVGTIMAIVYGAIRAVVSV